MAEGNFDLNAFNKRVESALERRQARRESIRPLTLIERLRIAAKQRREISRLPRL